MESLGEIEQEGGGGGGMHTTIFFFGSHFFSFLRASDLGGGGGISTVILPGALPAMRHPLPLQMVLGAELALDTTVEQCGGGGGAEHFFSFWGDAAGGLAAMTGCWTIQCA